MMSTGNSVPSLRSPNRFMRRAHLPRPGVRVVVFAMAGMAPAKALRHQVFDGLPEQLRLRVTKQFRRTRVRATDHPFGIRDKNRVGRNIKQILQRGMSELGPFVLGRSRCVLFRGIRWAHGLVGPCLRRYAVSPSHTRNLAKRVLQDAPMTLHAANSCTLRYPC